MGIAVGAPWSGVMKLALIRLLVAVTTAAAALAAPGDPHLAWWALAVGGAVLAVVDAQTLLLPARFVYPLAGVVGCALLTAAVIDRDLSSLFGAVAAALVIGLLWFGVRFVSPPAMGLGDVRLAALTGGVLGWTGWAIVWHARS